jgi:hypothetical protein
LIELWTDGENARADEAERITLLSTWIVSVEDERLVGFHVGAVDLAYRPDLVDIEAGRRVLSWTASYRFRAETNRKLSAMEGDA